MFVLLHDSLEVCFHQKLNGIESQRTPFSKLLARAMIDTQVVLGSVQERSC